MAPQTLNTISQLYLAHCTVTHFPALNSDEVEFVRHTMFIHYKWMVLFHSLLNPSYVSCHDSGAIIRLGNYRHILQSFIAVHMPSAFQEVKQLTKHRNLYLILRFSAYLIQTESYSVFNDLASSAIIAKNLVLFTACTISL